MSAATFRNAFDEADDFLGPIPDSSVLSAGRRTPPAFPGDVFMPDLWRLAIDMADGSASPVDYVACSMLATAAAAIGATRKVQPYRGHKWTEPCILWIGAVGDPSAGKSPAIEGVIEPLREIEREMAGEFTSTLRNWETDELSAKCARDSWAAQVKDASKNGVGVPIMPECAVAPEKPSRPRLLVMDSTPEAIAGVLVSNPRLLSYRDELAGWFQGFDRYAPGGRTQWLEAFGGRPFVVDRKGADAPIVIPFNGVSVLGGIQPDKLASIVLSGDDDGLAARFAWTWPRAVPYKRPHRVADPVLWPSILRKLTQLQMVQSEAVDPRPMLLPLDSDAADIFEAWRSLNGASANDGGSLFKSFVGKLPGIMLRVSLVLELIEWAASCGPEPTTITAVSLMHARTLVDEYLKPMAMRVFGDAALSPDERNAATLARFVIREKAKSINLKEVRRKKLPGLSLADSLAAAVDVLLEANWLFPAGKRDGSTPGRASKDYTVNPAVHTVDHGNPE